MFFNIVRVLVAAASLTVFAARGVGGDGPEPGCSNIFHVWQPGQDAQQLIRDVHFKMDNLTSYTRAELAEMRAHLSAELSSVHNWTYAVDRRVFQMQLGRMDDELIQMKFSASSHKVKTQLDKVNRRVDDLEQALYGVRSRLRSGAPECDVTRPPDDNRPQQQGISRDLGQVLRNSVSDLQAEWILLKRDLESVKKRTSTLVARQAELTNDTVSLKLSLSVSDARTERAENRLTALDDHYDTIESTLHELTSESTTIKRVLEQNRQDTLQNGAKVSVLQAKFTALEREMRDVQRLMDESRQTTNPPTRREDAREAIHLTDGQKDVSRGAMAGEDGTLSRSGGGNPAYTAEQDGEGFPRDCHEVYLRGYRLSSVYHIHVEGARYILPVYCEMINNTGYTLIQRRIDGTLDFNRRWSEYKHGFGNPYGEMWAGNQFIHLLAVQKKYALRIDFWDWDGEQYFAEYSRFYVEDEGDHYKLQVGGYTGSAGDSLSYHNRMAFSTEDMDNDLHERNCATENKGGWWYSSCFYSQLNGLYHTAWYSRTKYPDGIVWYTLKNSEFYSLKKVEMKLKPQNL